VLVQQNARRSETGTASTILLFLKSYAEPKSCSHRQNIKHARLHGIALTYPIASSSRSRNTERHY
jgi:hypothetical protein